MLRWYCIDKYALIRQSSMGSFCELSNSWSTQAPTHTSTTCTNYPKFVICPSTNPTWNRIKVRNWTERDLFLRLKTPGLQLLFKRGIWAAFLIISVTLTVVYSLTNTTVDIHLLCYQQKCRRIVNKIKLFSRHMSKYMIKTAISHSNTKLFIQISWFNWDSSDQSENFIDALCIVWYRLFMFSHWRCRFSCQQWYFHGQYVFNIKNVPSQKQQKLYKCLPTLQKTCHRCDWQRKQRCVSGRIRKTSCITRCWNS